MAHTAPVTVPDDLITLAEASEIAYVSHWSIRRRIAEGRLRGFRFGPKLLRVSRAEVEALLVIVPSAGAR